jgi:hypothetical protein
MPKDVANGVRLLKCLYLKHKASPFEKKEEDQL